MMVYDCKNNYFAAIDKNFHHVFAILPYHVNFFVTLNKLLHLGIKNMRAYFVLHSIFRNFVARKAAIHDSQ